MSLVCRTRQLVFSGPPLSGSNDPERWSAVSGVERVKEAWPARLLGSNLHEREIADDRPDGEGHAKVHG